MKGLPSGDPFLLLSGLATVVTGMNPDRFQAASAKAFRWESRV